MPEASAITDTCVNNIADNTYYISWVVGDRKVSRSKSHLQGISRSLVMVPVDFLLVFRCNCVSLVPVSEIISLISPKLKR